MTSDYFNSLNFLSTDELLHEINDLIEENQFLEKEIERLKKEKKYLERVSEFYNDIKYNKKMIEEYNDVLDKKIVYIPWKC